MTTSNKPPNHGTSPARPNASPRGDRIDWLFRSFLFSYGNQWLDKWSGQRMADVSAYWRGRLSGFDDATLRAAREAWIAQAGPGGFPPDADAFENLCKACRVKPIAGYQLPDKRPPSKETMQKIGGILDRLRKKARLL
jgi:hypothetical protein